MFPIRDKVVPPHLLPHIGVMKEVFDDEEIDRIRFFEKILDFAPAKTIQDQTDKTEAAGDYRSAKLATMPVDQNTQWLWEKIAFITGKANYDLFMYDIDMLETIDYIIYKEDDKYDVHRDITARGYRTHDRKISGVVMLSDKSDYEGGELEINVVESNMDSYVLQKGDVIFFDSWFNHRVTPVTKGNRHVLVFWAHGKNKL